MRKENRFLKWGEKIRLSRFSLAFVLFIGHAIASGNGGVPIAFVRQLRLLEEMLHSTGDCVVFRSQVENPPPIMPNLPLPDCLSRIETPEDVLGILLNRCLVLQEADRAGVPFPSTDEVAGALDAWKASLALNPALTDNRCHSPEDARWYVRENIRIKRFLDLRYRPIVRVMPQEIAQFAAEQGFDWNELSPTMVSSASKAVEEILTNRKINERLLAWLAEKTDPMIRQ